MVTMLCLAVVSVGLIAPKTPLTCELNRQLDKLIPSSTLFFFSFADASYASCCVQNSQIINHNGNGVGGWVGMGKITR